jgi:endonuclease III
MTAATVLLNNRLCEKYQWPIPARRSTLLRAPGVAESIVKRQLQMEGKSLDFQGHKKAL